MGFNKKVLSKAVSELGKAKAPAKPRDIITDPAGQWKYPGQKTRIPGSSITMQGVNYPVWAQPNVGPGSMMQPNQDYEFPGADYVDETPMGRKGGTLKSKKYSKSISATNKLFAKNKLFENKKSKIFDPNSKFKSGGSKLGPINLNPNPLSHYELNYGFNLPTKQEGGEPYDEELELTDEEIQAYRDGGYVVEEVAEYKIGGYVQHELVKAQKGLTKKPLEIADPKEFAYRDRAYKDSLDMYKNNLLATKYYDLANNPAYEDDFFINAKKGSTYIEKMKKIKKNSPAKFNSVFDKQKKPVQPVVFKNGITNINYTKSKLTPSKKDDFISIPQRKKIESLSTQFEKQKIDDRIITDTDVVPEGYRRIGNLYTASRDEKTGKVTEKEKFMHELIPHLNTRPIQQFASSEQSIIPGKPYVKPKPNVGPRYGTLAGDENLELPAGYTQQEREAARRQRDAQEFQRKTLEYQQQQRGNSPVAQMRKQGGAITESWEDELDDHTIELLRKAGYTVEELD